MLDTEFFELQKIGQRLDYKINIGNVWTPAGSLVQMQVHAGLQPEDTGIFLVLEVKDNRLLIAKHRTEALTTRYGGKAVTRHWVEEFMKSNVPLLIKAQIASCPTVASPTLVTLPNVSFHSGQFCRRCGGDGGPGGRCPSCGGNGFA